MAKMRRDIMERCIADVDNRLNVQNGSNVGKTINEFDNNEWVKEEGYIRSKMKQCVHLPESNACYVAVVEKINSSNTSEIESLQEKSQQFRIQREKDEVLNAVRSRRTQVISLQN